LSFICMDEWLCDGVCTQEGRVKGKMMCDGWLKVSGWLELCSVKEVVVRNPPLLRMYNNRTNCDTTHNTHFHSSLHSQLTLHTLPSINKLSHSHIWLLITNWKCFDLACLFLFHTHTTHFTQWQTKEVHVFGLEVSQIELMNINCEMFLDAMDRFRKFNSNLDMPSL
jgi:hypothetical protein